MGLWNKRYANLRFAFVLCLLTFGLVWSLVHGETVSAAVIGVFWTFDLAIGLASVVLWLRRGSTKR